MRVACIHIPQFALQSVTRGEPRLRGAALAIVGADPAQVGRGGPIVRACSRAARDAGVRVGVAASQLRGLAAAVEVVTVDPVRERETVRAIADAMLALSPCVEVTGLAAAASAPHLAIYCEVPAKTRGAAFGERVIEHLAVLGISARVGIADDRFTAWVAATDAMAKESHVVAVPRGGSPAFLAPRPLSLLAISLEVQHMLESLGVRTLGEFAALPAPSVARPLEADYQALARGESGNTLRPYSPEAPIREDLALGADGTLRLLAERVALRLHGRARAAAKLEVTVASAAGERAVVVTGGEVRSSDELEHAIRDQLVHDGVSLADIWRIRAVVVGEALVGGSETAEGAPAIVDTLSLVLSSTGGSLDLALGPISALPPPIAERRFLARRTRRGKERRRIDNPIQPRLFKL